MRLGERVTWTPSAFEAEVSGQGADRVRKTRTVTGRVAYIHPEGRYYMAEAKVNGAVLRECFPVERQKEV